MSLTGKPSLTTAAAFVNDGFWPDLSVADLMDKYRVPAEYADDTIKWGLTLAMVNVNLDLEPVKAAIVLLGYASLSAYNTANPNTLNSEQVTALHYQHAVYAFAKAQLLQQFNSMNRRDNAAAAAKESPDTEHYWLNQSAKAVQTLFAKFLPLEPKTATAGTHVALL